MLFYHKLRDENVFRVLWVLFEKAARCWVLRTESFGHKKCEGTESVVCHQKQSFVILCEGVEIERIFNKNKEF